MITLPAAVYDVLELNAEIYGGIGAYRMFVEAAAGDSSCPVCPAGMLMYAGALPFDPQDLYSRAVMKGFQALGLTWGASDSAVQALHEARIGRFDANHEWRVPFFAWCQEMGVTRGAE